MPTQTSPHLNDAERLPQPGLTVGDVIDSLAQFDRSLPVVIETPDMEFQVVHRINPPCGDEDEAQRGVCLVGGRYV